MNFVKNFTKKRITTLALISLLIFWGTFYWNISTADAALITSTSIQPSNSIPSATGVQYAVKFTFPDATPLECIQIKFATTTAMSTPATSMTSASGFSLTGGGLTSGNWTNYGSTNGTLEIYAASAQTPSSGGTPTITWTGVGNTSITNPTNIYAQITTFTTESGAGATCTTQVDQSNINAMLFSTGVATSVSVDPSLTFSVANDGSAVNGSGDTGFVTTTSSTIPFGTVDAGLTGVASQTLTVSTNASHGYNLYINKTGTMTDSNSDTYRDQGNLLSAPAAFDGSTTQTSFAVTDDSTNNSLGSNKWGAIQNTPNSDAIDSATGPVNAQAVHDEFKVETSNTQAPGTYNTTVIYTAAPSY